MRKKNKGARMQEQDKQKLNRLLLAVADGHAECLDGILEILGGRMLAVAAGILGERAAAEDAVHDSFLKIARFAGRYKRETDPVAWILKLVKNTALDAVRKKKRHPEASADELYSLTSFDYSPEKRENALVLESAMRQLKPDERQAIFLRYYADMTVREIAEAMQLSRSSAERLIQRAEQELKKILIAGQTD